MSCVEEMKWVVSIPDEVWRMLAVGTPSPWEQLKDETIMASHVCEHFIWRRVISPASELPWKLVRGDRLSNLRSLAKLESPPEEPVSGNMWHLLQTDYPEESLVRVLDLLAEVPWTSLPAEQQHGSLAVLRRWHKDYSAGTLVSRGLLHQVARLIPSPSDDEKRMHKLLRRLTAIATAHPQKAGGRQLLVQAMIRVARTRKDVAVMVG